jgi:polyhydroxybutyrate depolymerase
VVRSGPIWWLLLALTLVGCSEYQHLEHGSQTRRYVLHTPDEADGEVPLLVALHGRLGTGRGMARDSGFDALLEPGGFAAVYPDGYRRSWNDGRGGGPANEAGIDDVGFIEALLEEVAGQVSYDPNRVYLVGISNGGMMAQRLACERTGLFTATASIIASMSETVEQGCSPTTTMSMLLMNGTEDPLVPYEGGEVSGDSEGSVLSTAATVEFWRLHAGCDQLPEEQTIDALSGDSTSIRHEHYTGCQGEAAVELYEVIGGGHTWPGGPQYLSEDTVGRVSQELVAAETIWAWFEPLRREPL